MFCKFITVAENVHKCSVCGMQVALNQTPDKIWRKCNTENASQEPINLAINYAKAVITHTANGSANVSKEEEEKRRITCEGNGDIPKCEFFNENKCGKCGCSMMSEKWKWKTSVCPINKW